MHRINNLKAELKKITKNGNVSKSEIKKIINLNWEERRALGEERRRANIQACKKWNEREKFINANLIDPSTIVRKNRNVRTTRKPQ